MSSASSARKCSACTWSSLAFTMLYVGGIGTIAGAASAPVIVHAARDGARASRNIRTSPTARVLILILIYAPGGLASLSHACRDARERRAHDASLARTRSRSASAASSRSTTVSLDIAAGRHSAIIGPNGAGKTTLFNVISGFRAPTEGRVAFDGDDITGLAPERDRAARSRAHLSARAAVQGPHRAENVKVGCHLAHQGRTRQRADVRLARACHRGAASRTRARAACIRRARRARRHARRAPCPTASSACSKSPARSPPSPKLLLLDEPAAGLNRDETSRSPT